MSIFRKFKMRTKGMMVIELALFVAVGLFFMGGLAYIIKGHEENRENIYAEIMSLPLESTDSDVMDEDSEGNPISIVIRSNAPLMNLHSKNVNYESVGIFCQNVSGKISAEGRFTSTKSSPSGARISRTSYEPFELGSTLFPMSVKFCKSYFDL